MAPDSLSVSFCALGPLLDTAWFHGIDDLRLVIRQPSAAPARGSFGWLSKKTKDNRMIKVVLLTVAFLATVDGY